MIFMNHLVYLILFHLYKVLVIMILALRMMESVKQILELITTREISNVNSVQ